MHSLRYTYVVRRLAITGEIKIVFEEIGYSSVVMTEHHAKFNLRRVRDDFPSLKERISSLLAPV